MTNWIEAVMDDDLVLLKDAVGEKICTQHNYQNKLNKMTWLHTDDYKAILQRNKLRIEHAVNLHMQLIDEHQRRIKEKVPSPEQESIFSIWLTIKKCS